MNRLRRPLAVIFILGVILLPLFRVSADDWPQWRGLGRNGISQEKISWPSSGPKQLWKAAVGEGYSSVSVSKGRAYTMGNANNQDTVWCLDARTGAVVWKYSCPCPAVKEYSGPRSTPTVDGNLVYAVSRTGNLMGLDAVRGTLVWSANYEKDFGAKEPRWAFAGSPLVEGQLLLVNAGGTGASVVAFDKTTGHVVWKSGTDAAGYSSPVTFTVGMQRIVAMFSANGLHGYNLAEGKELWSAKWTTPAGINASDPIIFGDKVFITSGYGCGCSLLKMTNTSVEPVYQNRNFCGLFDSQVLIGGFLYGFTGQINAPVLACLDPNTGVLKWKNPKVCGSLIAAGNNLIIQSLTGGLILAEADSGAYKEIGAGPALTGTSWTAPSLANGCVYCRDNAGDVVCLELCEKGFSNSKNSIPRPEAAVALVPSPVSGLATPAQAPSATQSTTPPSKANTGEWAAVPQPKGWPHGFIAVNRAKGDLYFNTFGKGLWRTSDCAKTWEHLGNDKFFPNAIAPYRNNLPGTVVINPDDSKIVVFSFQELNRPLPPNSCAYSLDDGKTWEAMQYANSGFIMACVEPGKGQAILAADASARTLSFSPDLGKTWKLDPQSADFKGVGLFSAQEWVRTTKSGGIKSTSDAGKTWAASSPVNGCGGPLLIIKGIGIWISPQGLMMTKDHGKTWSVEGTPPPSVPIPFLPAVLGKDEKHFFILTQGGLAETRDLGKTWKILTPLPAEAAKYNDGFDLAFDPVHDFFYLSAHFHGPTGMLAYHWQK